MSTVSHTAEKPERPAPSPRQNKSSDLLPAARAAPATNVQENEHCDSSKRPLRPFREIWADLMTLLSLAICAWFLARMLCQLWR